MKKRFSQAGFTLVEVILAIALLAGVGIVAYYVWQNHTGSSNTGTTKIATSSSTSYKSPSTSTPKAPSVTNTSDLTKAMNALNQTSISSNNVDSSQLSTESSSF